jgi:hypothetical protein
MVVTYTLALEGVVSEEELQKNILFFKVLSS